MTTFTALLTKFARDDEGAALIEYSILIGIISAGVIVLVGSLGTEIIAKFQVVCTALKGTPCAV